MPQRGCHAFLKERGGKTARWPISARKGHAMDKLGVIINLGFAFAVVAGATILMVI